MAGRAAGLSTGHTFGQLLRQFREAGSLTQEELAERARVSAHAVSALERGLRTRPYPSTVRSLADALGISDRQREQLFAAVPTRQSVEGVHHAPAAAADGTQQGIPNPAATLIARERELEELTSLLIAPHRRVVTLTGIGGVGKTRLAIAVARTVSTSFRDGAVFVPLAPVLDPQAVPSVIADRLGALGGTDPMLGAINHLRGRSVLLVLDNAEHLLGAAPLVAEIAEACPEVTVLVTSRAPLRIRGETEFVVPPLDGAAAALMFLDRAPGISAGAQLTPEHAQAVAGICDRLAGIPLALELAAARTRVLDPSSLLARLDDVVLADGARDLPARQRTMQATLDWSYGLLSPAERSMLRLLSVFSGGFTLTDAESVAEATGTVSRGDVLPLVEMLAEHSLVTTTEEAHGRRRHGLLEPVAQYGRHKLDEAGERLLAGAAHIQHFLDLAERAAPELEGPHHLEWLERVDAEHANMTAAIRHAIGTDQLDAAGRLAWSLWLYWGVRGHARRGWHLLEAVLQCPVSEPVRTRAEVAAAMMAFACGDVTTSRELWTAALARSRLCADLVSEANALSGLGLVALWSGDMETAQSLLQRSVPVSEAAGPEGERMGAMTQGWLSSVARAGGDLDQALLHATAGLESARRRGDRPTMYIALYYLSEVESARGNEKAARRYLCEGLLLAAETGDLTNVAYLLDASASLEEAVHAYDAVPVLLGAAQGVREELGDVVFAYYRTDRARRQRSADHARLELGDDAFEDGLDRGRAMNTDEAVAFAHGRAD